MKRAGPILFLLAVAVALDACVTEVVRPGDAPQRTDPNKPSPFTDAVAAPALDARTLNAHLKVALTPLGSVEYDAQTLPRISPDGRFIAVQQGLAPTWPTILAQPDATVPVGTRIAVYDISATAPRRIDPVDDLPPGLILARAPDNQGFLVESPRPDGSRWIGRISWVGARLTWLVQDDRVNTHATTSAGGVLAYATRPINQDAFSLVLAGQIIEPSQGASLEHPFAPDDPELIYALERSSRGIFAIAMRRRPGSTTVLARVRLSASTEPLVAYQIATPAALVPDDDPARPPALMLYLTRAQRMSIFDPAGGTLAPLPDKSIAAARDTDPELAGYFCTTPEGLVFTPPPKPTDPWDPQPGRPAPVANVLADPFVPWATNDDNRPFILVGPDPNHPDRLRLFALKPIH